jgi:hypothetical protein
MVRLQQVPEDYNESDLSEVSDFEEDIDQDDYMEIPYPETFIDRILFLQYMLPHSWRSAFTKTVNRFYGFGRRFFLFTGGTCWVIVTTVLLVGLPLFLEYEKEQSLIAYESGGNAASSAAAAAVGSVSLD